MAVPRRSVPRRAVSSTRSIKANLQPNDDIQTEDLYPYLIKLAILYYRTEPRFWVPIQVPQSDSSPQKGHARRMSSLPNSSHSELLEFSKSKASLPSKIPELLDEKLKEIAYNKTFYSNDEFAKRIFLAFYAGFNETTKREISKSKRVEDLLMKFISTSEKEIGKAERQNFEIANSDYYTCLFCQLLLQILKENKYYQSHANLITQLERYKSSLAQSSTLRPNSTNGSRYNGTINTPETPTFPTPSFQLSDMNYAYSLVDLFNTTDSRVQQSIDSYKNQTTIELAVSELKGIRDELQANNHHLTYQRSHFSSESAYHQWKAQELLAIDAIIEKFTSRHPSIAEVYSSQPIISNNQVCYNFTPPDPKSYYKLLLQLCLQRDSKQWDSSSDLILSKKSQDLLNKVAYFWRISAITRSRILLYVTSSLYEKDVFTLDKMKTKVFPLIDRLELENGARDIWTEYDRRFSFETMQKLHTKIIDQVIDRLDGIYDTKKPAIGPLLQFIGDYVVPNAEHEGYPSLDITPDQIAKAEEKIKEIADQKYYELVEEIPRDKNFSSTHICQLANNLISMAERLQKRYKHPLFNQIETPIVATKVTLESFAEDSKIMISYLLSNSTPDDFSLKDLMELYKSLKQVRDLYIQLFPTPFTFDIETKLDPFVFYNIQSSSEILVSWVEANVEKDTFSSPSEASDSLISSSVKDSFASFNSASKLVKDLGWTNEVQLAKYYTSTMKVSLFYLYFSKPSLLTLNSF